LRFTATAANFAGVTRQRETDWRLLGCAAAIGAAIALPAGIVAGRYGFRSSETTNPNGPASVSGRRGRDIFAPDFRNDPNVIEQQRRVVEALEQSCRHSKLHCKEAEQARLRVEEAAAGK
jgi:hypothetical protein